MRHQEVNYKEDIKATTNKKNKTNTTIMID